MHNAAMDKYELRRQKLRELIDDKYDGVVASLARESGIDPSYLSRMLYPEGKKGKKRIGEDMVEKITKIHPGCFGEYADASIPTAFYSTSEEQGQYNTEPAPELRNFKDVPVVGTVQGGDNGFYTELDMPAGDGDGYITYPAKDRNSYALRVKGDSMRPRIKNGEFIVVEPNHEAQPGDDVVVVFNDGRRMVKELLYIRDGVVTLGSINNGHGNISADWSEIEKIHYVAAIIPRGAFYKNEPQNQGRYGF